MYRSGLEEEVAKQLRKSKIPYTYEKYKIRYRWPAENKVYTPDFKIITKSGKEIILEAKGIWLYQDRYKHLLVRQQYPELDIRFIFSNSKKRISKVSKTKYRDICEGRGRSPFKGVTWKYCDVTIPRSWLEE